MNLLTHPASKQFLATVSDLTRTAYAQSFAVTLPMLGVRTTRDLEKLQRRKVMEVRDQLLAKYKPSTVKAYLSAPSSLARYLMALDVIDRNPFSGLPSIRVGMNAPEWNVLDERGVKKILGTARGDDAVSRRDFAVLLAILNQGLRATELCKLRWENIEVREGKRVLVFKGKGRDGGKDAVMHLREPTYEALIHYNPPGKPGGVVVPKTLGDPAPLTRFDVYDLVARRAREAGLRVTPHGLRASMITDAVKRLGIATASKLARHTWITTTQRYDRRGVVEDTGGGWK